MFSAKTIKFATCRGVFRRFIRFTSSVECSNNVYKSPFNDIVVPKVLVHEYVWQNLDRWPEKTAVVCGITGRGYTYEQAFKLSNNFAAFLRSKLHMQDGDCIAIVMPNGPDYPLVLLGGNEAGLVVTTINPVYTPDEISRQLLLSNAKIMVVDAAKVDDVNKALVMAKVKLPIIVTNESLVRPEGTISFRQIVEDSGMDKSCLKTVRRTGEDVGFLPYSSGTTGLPKGVELLNRNLTANCEQQNDPNLRYYRLTDDQNQESILALLPMFHIYALTCIVFHKMSIGCKLVTLPSFQMATFLDAIMAHKVTGLYVAPPLVIAMGSHQDVKKEHFENLRFFVSGAAPLAIGDTNRLFEKAGRQIQFAQGYGLTETSPVITLQTDTEHRDECGPPLPSTDFLIVDENGNRLGVNQPGEIWVKGPQVMRGYKDNPKATEEVLTSNGWFKTGDIGVFNERGSLIVTDRLKELIKVKGFQVAPAELEAILRDHPSIVDAAVIGVPDQRTGETPKAFVVLKEPCEKAAILEFVKSKVAPFKRLSDVVVLDAIPKSVSGKILRKELKSKYC